MYQHLFSYTLSTLALCCLPTADASVLVLSQDAQPWTVTHMAPTYPNLWRIVISSHSSLALALDFYANETTNIPAVSPANATPLANTNANYTSHATCATVNAHQTNDTDHTAYPTSAYTPVYAYTYDPIEVSALALTSAHTTPWPLHRNLTPLDSAIFAVLNSTAPYTIIQLRVLNGFSTFNRLNQLNSLNASDHCAPDSDFSSLDNLANLDNVATLSDQADTPFNTQPPDGFPPQLNLMLNPGTPALSHLTAKFISPLKPPAPAHAQTQTHVLLLTKKYSLDLVQANESALELQEVAVQIDCDEDKLTLEAMHDKEQIKEKLDAKRQGQSQAPWEQVSAWFKQYQTS